MPENLRKLYDTYKPYFEDEMPYEEFAEKMQDKQNRLRFYGAIQPLTEDFDANYLEQKIMPDIISKQADYNYSKWDDVPKGQKDDIIKKLGVSSGNEASKIWQKIPQSQKARILGVAPEYYQSGDLKKRNFGSLRGEPVIDANLQPKKDYNLGIKAEPPKPTPRQKMPEDIKKGMSIGREIYTEGRETPLTQPIDTRGLIENILYSIKRVGDIGADVAQTFPVRVIGNAMGTIPVPGQDVPMSQKDWETYQLLRQGGYARAEELLDKPNPVASTIADVADLIKARPPIGTERLPWYSPERAATTIATESLPMATFVLSSMLNPAVSQIYMGGAEEGEQLRDMMEYEKRTGNKIPIEQKMGILAGTNIINSALERAGIETIMGKMPGSVRSRLIKGIYGALGEGITEGAQQITQILGKMGYDITPDLEDAAKEVWDAVYGGIVLGGGTSGVMQGVRSLNDLRNYVNQGGAGLAEDLNRAANQISLQNRLDQIAEQSVNEFLGVSPEEENLTEAIRYDKPINLFVWSKIPIERRQKYYENAKAKGLIPNNLSFNEFQLLVTGQLGLTSRPPSSEVQMPQETPVPTEPLTPQEAEELTEQPAETEAAPEPAEGEPAEEEFTLDDWNNLDAETKMNAYQISIQDGVIPEDMTFEEYNQAVIEELGGQNAGETGQMREEGQKEQSERKSVGGVQRESEQIEEEKPTGEAKEKVGEFKKGIKLPEKNIVALQLDDGRIFYDTQAKTHADVFNSIKEKFGINESEVKDGGFIINGEYKEGSADAKGISEQAKAKIRVQAKRLTNSIKGKGSKADAIVKKFAEGKTEAEIDNVINELSNLSKEAAGQDISVDYALTADMLKQATGRSTSPEKHGVSKDIGERITYLKTPISGTGKFSKAAITNQSNHIGAFELYKKDDKYYIIPNKNAWNNLIGTPSINDIQNNVFDIEGAIGGYWQGKKIESEVADFDNLQITPAEVKLNDDGSYEVVKKGKIVPISKRSSIKGGAGEQGTLFQTGAEPDINSTGSAVKFGWNNRGNKEAIDYLKTKEKEFTEKYNAAKNIQERMEAATQKQFYTEALDVAEGRKTREDIVKQQGQKWVDENMPLSEKEKTSAEKSVRQKIIDAAPNKEIGVVHAEVADILITRIAKNNNISKEEVYNLIDLKKHSDIFDNPDEIFYHGPKGTIEFKGGKAIITIYKNSNASTFLHEIFHFARRNGVLTQSEEQTLLDAVGETSWNVAAEEKSARMFERYLRDGKAPNSKLKPLFDKIKQFMTDVYNAIKGSPIDINISPEVRAIFDKIMAGSTGSPTKTSGKASTEDITLKQLGGSLQDILRKAKKGAKPKKKKERSFPKTLEKEGLEGGYDREYDVFTDKRAFNLAKSRINESEDKAFLYVIDEDAVLSKEQVATGILLMRRYDSQMRNMKEGAEKEAIAEKQNKIATVLGRRLTQAGQSIQAASIVQRLTPEGVLIYAKKKVEKLKKKGKKVREITTEDVKNIHKRSKLIKEESDFQGTIDDAVKVINDYRKSGKLTTEDVNKITKAIDGLNKKFNKKPTVRKSPTLTDKLDKRLSDLEKQARERLKKRGVQFNVGLDPRDIADLSIIGAAKLGKTGIKFIKWSNEMINDLGEDIKPHLKKIFKKSINVYKTEKRRVRNANRLETELRSILRKIEASTEVNEIDLETISELMEEAKDFSDDVKIEVLYEMQEFLNRLKKPTVLRKIGTAQTISMLLNTKTIIRNIGGNEIFYIAEFITRNFVSVPIDWTVSKVTGTDRTIVFKAGQYGYWKGFFEGAKAGWQGRSVRHLDTQFSLSGPAFESKFNPLTWAEKALGASLRGFDAAAFTRAYNEFLHEQAEIHIVNNKLKFKSGDEKAKFVKDFIEKLDYSVLEMADLQGKYITFQDENNLSKFFVMIKRGLNIGKGFGLGDLILKFPKTPANLINRGFAYSPFGVIRSLSILSKTYTDPNMKRRDVIMSLSRAITGTFGFTGLGAYLYSIGVITAGGEDDKDVAFLKMQQTGLRRFQVNASAIKRFVTGGFNMDDLKLRSGDTLYSYDWAMPVSFSITLGANLAKNLSLNRGGLEGSSDIALESLNTALTLFADQPMLKGLQDFLGDSHDKNKINRAARIFQNVPASFVPTLASQIRQYTDNNRRVYYDTNALQTAINKAIYKLPFVYEKLPLAFKTFGIDNVDEVYRNGTNTFFNVFFNPGFVAKYEIDPEIYNLLAPYEQEGRKDQIPKVAPFKIKVSKKTLRKYGIKLDNETEVIRLSAEDYSEFQRIMANDFTNSFRKVNLKNMTYEQQERILARYVSRSMEEAKKWFYKNRIKDYLNKEN